jgi:ankyrin repeat protein
MKKEYSEIQPENKGPELIKAVKNKDSSSVELILKDIQPEELNYQDTHGKTALHYAVNQPEISKALLEKNADISIRSKSSHYLSGVNSPLNLSSDRDGFDPIGSAIQEGDSNFLSLIVDHLKKHQKPDSHSTDSSIDYPSSSKSSSNALTLFSSGYYTGEEKYKYEHNEIDKNTKEKPEPFYIDPVVRLLMIDEQKKAGNTSYLKTDCVSLPIPKFELVTNPEASFVEEKAGLSNNLHLIAERKADLKPGLIREVITHLHGTGQYEINGKDSLGRTPLHRAIQMKNLEAVETLLDLGANVNSEYYKPVTEERIIQQYAEKALESIQIQDPALADLEKIIFQESFEKALESPQIQDSTLADLDAELSLFNHEIHPEYRQNKKIKTSPSSDLRQYGDTPLIMALKSIRHAKPDEDLTSREREEKEVDMRIMMEITKNPNLNFNTPGDDSKTALHFIAEKSTYEMMEVFLKTK